MANWFPEQAESDLTYLVHQKNGDQNDKTIIIIELGFRKISWFVSVSQINIIICLSLQIIIDLLATDKPLSKGS